MNDNSDFDQLDALLARPAVMADRGFSERVMRRARNLHRTRRNLFLLMGLGWFLLMFIAATPQAIYTDMSTLTQSLDIGSLYPYVLGNIQSAIASPEQLPFTEIAVAMLSLAAVVSMAIRA